MYFHNLKVSLLVATTFLLSLCNAGVKLEWTDEDFIYYYNILDIEGIPPWRDMPSPMLAEYAFEAYDQMIDFRRPRDVPRHDKPTMISAMWVPAKQAVFISSSARYVGDANDGEGFAYHPANVPVQIRALLRMSAVSGNWVSDYRTTAIHNKGGACAEIVTLSTYFSEYPLEAGLPSPRGAKIVTVGNEDQIVGGDAVVVNPCLNTRSGGGCRDTLRMIGMRWCGPASLTDPLTKRDSGSKASETKFECHGANEAPDFSNTQVTYASVATNSSTYADTATQTASVDENEISLTVTPSGFAVNTAGVTVTGTSLKPAPTSSSAAATPKETGAVDASTIVGDPDKESDYCVQECVAAFKSCISGSDTDRIGSVSAMDCHAAAACYCTTPPYETPESSAQPGSAPANPQDPASDPELLASKIDISKVDELCTNTCQSLEAGDAKKTAPNTAPFGVEVEDASGTSFNLTDSWNCIKEAQKPGAAADAVCTIS